MDRLFPTPNDLVAAFDDTMFPVIVVDGALLHDTLQNNEPCG